MIRFKQRLDFRPSSESGFNLIESLVAVVVVSVLMVAVAPVIVYSVGTRVQAKRIQLATQAAGSYVDAVRAGSMTPLTPGSTKPSEVAAPSTGSLECSPSQICDTPASSGSTQLYCVDFDGEMDGENLRGCTTDSLTDMVVQGIAYNPNSDDPEDGFCLGIRVYRANSLASGITLKSPPEQSDQVTTNAIGNRELPLLQMTTEISPGETTQATRLDAMNRRIQSSSNRSCGD